MGLTVTDLDEWARRRAVEGELPELVRRLIYATLDDRDLVRLVVPADEGVSKTGVDGWVQTREGNTYVPRGTSAWEVGRGEDYEKKAQADYRARTTTRPPPGVDLEQTTFVFVTPRRWADHADWELKRRKEQRWRDVRVYDADVLIDWLRRAPAVWAWFTELIGRPGPLRSLDCHHTPPATTTHRVEAYLDDLQAQGRYVFDLDALEQAIGDQPDILRVLADLPSVAQICEGAYVIVRPEYRRLGAPPPSWYIDAIMTRAKQRYCVGLLSAAALHGAADQQPQLFQVLVEHPTEPAKVGAHTIEFVAREREQEFTTEPLNTETGVMLVATPEATVFDLTEFADHCGGRDAVISVLEELGEDLQAERLFEIAPAYPPWVIEKAAAMLDEAGHGRLAQSLRQPPSPRPVLGAQ